MAKSVLYLRQSCRGPASDERKRREAEVQALLDTHQYEEALKLQEQLNLESHEQRKRDVMQSFIDERSAFSAKIDGDAELQAEYDFIISQHSKRKKCSKPWTQDTLLTRPRLSKITVTRLMIFASEASKRTETRRLARCRT